MNEESKLKSWEDRFFEHLPDTDDLSLMVLKGHLLIEEQLNELISIKCISPECLEKARLTFNQKIHILKALYGKEIMTDSDYQLWVALESLNSIRNKLSHNLEPDNLDKKVETFIRTFMNDTKYKYTNEKKATNTLKHILCFLSGYISSTILHKSKASNKMLKRDY